MKYSEQAIEKYLEKAKESLNRYKAIIESGEYYNICISNGNPKIGRAMNVSMLPIFTCHNCGQCKDYCYDIKACLQYKQVIPARAKNTALAMLDPAEFFRQIDEKMNRRQKNKYFRFHVAGDMLNMDYLQRVIEIAKKHPDFTIWTYTKYYTLVNLYVKKYGMDAIPKNLHVMFSEWRGLRMDNPYKFPEFRVVMSDDEYKPDPAKHFYCPGNCDICKASGRGCIAGETVYCNEH